MFLLGEGKCLVFFEYFLGLGEGDLSCSDGVSYPYEEQLECCLCGCCFFFHSRRRVAGPTLVGVGWLSISIT